MSPAWLLVAISAAAPKLDSISAPFGYAGRVVTEPVGAGIGTERLVNAAPNGCPDKQTIHLTALVNAALKAVEQLQPWLEKQPGLEGRLFAGRFKLSDLMEFLTVAIPSEKHACKAPTLSGGSQLSWGVAPKLCDGETSGPWGDFWWTSRGAPAIAVELTAPRAEPKGSKDEPPIACRPRFSVLLFDAKGVVRLRWNAEYLGNLSVTLVAEGCTQVDFALDLPSVAFVPTIRSTPGCTAK